MMHHQKLTPEAYGRAVKFMHQAQPLERALFAFHFENTPADLALKELQDFQNPDGGFHGLEADTGFDFSTVLSTCRALHLLHELYADAAHPAVVSALDYLLATFDAARGAWPIIPPHDNSQPHAPWWHCADDIMANWGGYIDNPRPDVLAGLHLFKSATTDALRKQVASLTLEHLRSLDGPMEMHGLMCYLRLHAAPGVDGGLQAELDRRLPEWIVAAVEPNATKWTGYGMRPLDAAPFAYSPWRSVLGAAIDENLDYLIATQTDDGSWHPHWNWGDTFPEAWREAKLRWQAVLTLGYLRTLRSYGRIAG